jgi:hypothetical protein
MKSSYKMAFITPVVALCACFLFGCQKDKDADGCTTDMPHIAGTYKLTALTYQNDGATAPKDFLPNIDDCEKDDLLELKANGTFVSHDAGTVCTPANDSQGTWGVNGKQITTDSGNFPTGTITSFDCKSLVYYVPDIYHNGDKLIFTLTRQ